MGELIPIRNNDGRQAVMGRDLHAFLEIQSNYTTWIARLIEKYGFIAGQDFIPKMEESSGGRPSENHVLTLDMAKEISMVQNNDKGRQARRYFIECERRAKEKQAAALPQDYASALRELAASVEQAELEKRRADEQELLAQQRMRAIEAQAPAVSKAQAHSDCKETKGRQEFAREVQKWGRQWGYEITQENVYRLLRRKGMLVSGERRDRNHATSKAEKAGWATTAKGVADNTGKPWAAARIKPKGQDIAWKWINKAAEQYGAELNPKEEK